MKKLLLAFLSAMLILSAAGCGSGTQTGEDNSIPKQMEIKSLLK